MIVHEQQARRVAKLRKQELNVAEEKLEKGGISVEEAVKLARNIAKSIGQMAEDIGKAFASLIKNIQRNMEGKE